MKKCLLMIPKPKTSQNRAKCWRRNYARAK